MRVFLFLSLCGILASRQPDVPAGWRIGTLPDYEAVDSLRNAQEWRVFLNGDSLDVDTYRQSWKCGPFIGFDRDSLLRAVLAKDSLFSPGNEEGCSGLVCSLRIENGSFIGSNAGEFGGCLEFRDTSGRSYRITGGNFTGIVRSGNRIFALEGLHHLSQRTAIITELELRDGKWTPGRWAKLPEIPGCATAGPKGEIIILAESHFLVFDPGTWNTRVLGGNSFWAPLYPNSLVLWHDNLYAGMHGGMLCTSYAEPSEQSWLIPQ